MRYVRGKPKKCIILSFADGDTVRILLQCESCESWHEKYLRINSIESWELKSVDKEKAIVARERLNETWGSSSGELVLKQAHTDKYGRLVGDININGTFLSSWIVKNKLGWYNHI